jgi:hypothetical protein
MDQVTQQNAEMVEQSRAASLSLSGEASEYARLVALFKPSRVAVPKTMPKLLPGLVKATSGTPGRAQTGKSRPTLITAGGKTLVTNRGVDKWDEV